LNISRWRPNGRPSGDGVRTARKRRQLMGAMREAYDMRNPFCRRNFWRRFKGYRSIRGKWSMVKLAWEDTKGRVCPPEA
jgi:hypothetical protein